MIKDFRSEKRKYDRYETDVKIQFYVNFNIHTKINYRIKDKNKILFSKKKYSAISKNVNVEGLCLTSERLLKKEDALLMEVYIPSSQQPILMEGQVRWSQPVDQRSSRKKLYDTGVRLITVNGESVEKSIFIDPVHHITWSIVLESIYGGFKHLVLKKKRSLPV